MPDAVVMQSYNKRGANHLASLIIPNVWITREQFALIQVAA